MAGSNPNESTSTLSEHVERSLDSILSPYCSNRDNELPRLSEIEVRQISQGLQRLGKESWSRTPRIYAVLYMIKSVQVIDQFISLGISDLWFPFSHSTLPVGLRSQSARSEFLRVQDFVLTKALDLEREDGRHRHFSRGDDLPLQKLEELGKGGFGYVDRVMSTITYKEYARKLIPRGKTFKKNAEILRDFERELSHLKKLSHVHIVELIGSYTDSKYVGILMAPVADYNLKDFLARDEVPQGDKSFLRTFYGCLAAAVSYLHEQQVRHKDIKPQNVLVKGHQVYLTDFGISLDWSDVGQSTTTGVTVKTPRYCAPEVAHYMPRNTLSDIWSLGCVYLEIWTVLKSHTVDALQEHLQQNGSKSTCYYQNLQSVQSWCDKLSTAANTREENVALTWINGMLENDQDNRWTALRLLEEIKEVNDHPENTRLFSGTCCVGVDDSSASSSSSKRTSMNLDQTGASSVQVYVPKSMASEKVVVVGDQPDLSSSQTIRSPKAQSNQEVEASAITSSRSGPHVRASQESKVVSNPEGSSAENKPMPAPNDEQSSKESGRDNVSSYVDVQAKVTHPRFGVDTPSDQVTPPVQKSQDSFIKSHDEPIASDLPGKSESVTLVARNSAEAPPDRSLTQLPMIRRKPLGSRQLSETETVKPYKTASELEQSDHSLDNNSKTNTVDHQMLAPSPSIGLARKYSWEHDGGSTENIQQTISNQDRVEKDLVSTPHHKGEELDQSFDGDKLNIGTSVIHVSPGESSHDTTASKLSDQSTLQNSNSVKPSKATDTISAQGPIEAERKGKKSSVFGFFRRKDKQHKEPFVLDESQKAAMKAFLDPRNRQQTNKALEKPKDTVTITPVDNSAVESDVGHSINDPQSEEGAKPDPDAAQKPQRICGRCQKDLTGQFVRALGGTFHLDCFTCHDCGKIVATKFFPTSEFPDTNGTVALCETDYFRRLDLICWDCGGALRGSYITALERKYHIGHFCCTICKLPFGEQDNYYEHEGEVYCHFHYAKSYARQCFGCQSAIIRAFVEIFRNAQNQYWHPNCYMIHKYWNVRLATPKTESESGSGSKEIPPIQPTDDERTAFLNISDTTEKMSDEVWAALSTFEEQASTFLSKTLDTLRKNDFLTSLTSIDKLYSCIRCLFQAYVLLAREAVLNGLKVPVADREAKLLCKKFVVLLTSILELIEQGSSSRAVQTTPSDALLDCITGLSHYLKLMIRTGLQFALKADQEQPNVHFLTQFLDCMRLQLPVTPGITDLFSSSGVEPFAKQGADACLYCDIPVDGQCFEMQGRYCHPKCVRCENCVNSHWQGVQETTSWMTQGTSHWLICSRCQQRPNDAFTQVEQLEQFCNLLRIAFARIVSGFETATSTRYAPNALLMEYNTSSVVPKQQLQESDNKLTSNAKSLDDVVREVTNVKGNKT